MLAEGVDQKQYLARLFMGKTRYNQITLKQRLRGRLAKDWRSIFSSIQKVFPTRNAHRIYSIC